ncbi:MAG: hypothetical protein K2P70_19665 [Hyphomonadaceae bacterium]|jgi:hypothetical protein|nr:hypothetical protein [Hyphomonadaceae bacterium]
MKKILIGVVLLLVVIGAAVVLAPRFLDQSAEQVTGELEGDVLVLRGGDFNAPDQSPEQTHSVADDRLLLTVLPNQPPPTPAERGVRILLAPERADLVNDKAVIVEVRYEAPATGAASALAVSLQGIEPADWQSQPIASGEGVARFELAPQLAVDAIGLRALSETPDQSGAINIVEIRVLPAPAQ